jgi:hypothetical protein
MDDARFVLIKIARTTEASRMPGQHYEECGTAADAGAMADSLELAIEAALTAWRRGAQSVNAA